MALTKITTSVVAANTLATANIADNSVDATKIASNSILTRHIDDDQITGDQLADNITIAGNLTITGNLTTNGSTVTNSSSNTTIEDAIIELGTGTSGAPATDAGIVIERGSSDNVFIGWDESADKVTVGTGSFTGASTGNLTITAAPFVSGALTASGISYPTSDGSAGQYLKTDGSGALSFGAVTTQVDNYTATGDGSTTAFDTGINPHNEVNTWIFIDGVYQQKSQYSYSGSTVTFSTAPENGALIDVVTGTTGGMASSDTVLGIYEATTTNTATYTTGISASNENNTWVFVGGVYQPKDSYTFSSGTLTFDANTPTGQKLSVVATKALTAGSVETTSLGANAVTAVKIASNSILSRHIANNSIVGADISATTGITAATFTGALTGNVTGNVAGNLTGTILTAAQTNITSVGTLSALTVSGQLTAGGIAYPTSDGSADQVLKTDGSGALSFGTISGTTINNNTNNYVITGTGSANTLNGESGLTFDGTNLVVGTTGALKVPNGTTAQKPTAATGMIRYNTTNTKLEAYIGSDWLNIKTDPQDLTQISGLQVWADVTGGISSTTVADLSGNNRTGTLTTATSNTGTLSGNTYFEAFGSNTLTYATGVLPNLPYTTGNACTFFFVTTNRKTYNTYATYLGSASTNVNYQIIRHDGTSANYNFYAENLSNWQVTASNAAPVNSTISEAYILIFTFKPNGGNSDVNIYKHENGNTTSETHSVSGNNQSFELTDNNSTVTIGTSSWSNEYLNAGVFAWGATNTEMSSADRQIIYDYYANKGLAN